MEPRINKPRIFLSHSKVDIFFIDRLYGDLRKCQIEPWLDSEEIRHGKPWLDAIFEDGIPTCDAVLVYFTEASIESKMLKKEMDVGILQQLKDKRIAFLPYINEEGIRGKLRADIQALQVPIWNNINYNDILPRVVAEIWRSFLERTITSAVQDERVHRLKAELELEKNKKQGSVSIFSKSEDTEFKYLWDIFNIWVPIEVIENAQKTNEVGIIIESIPVRKLIMNVKLSTVISVLFGGRRIEFSYWDAERLLEEQVKILFSESDKSEGTKNSYKIDKFKDLTDDLMMFGFIDLIYEPPMQNLSGPSILRTALRPSKYKHIYNNKCYRFRYWLAYNKMLPTSVEFGNNIEIIELAAIKQ